MRYDLRSEPWIPCWGPDGAVELGLAAVLGDAHSLTFVTGETATVTVAIERLLTAVLARIMATAGLGVAEVRAAGCLPATAVDDYLAAHADRLDLLSGEAPFMQVAGLAAAGRGPSTGLGGIVAVDALGGPAPATLGFAEAARWVVHCHAYNSAGIRTGMAGDPRQKSGRSYPIGPAWCGTFTSVTVGGATLLNTLLLSLPARLDPADVPCWERPCPGPAARPADAAPPGAVELMTWQARRIRLLHDDQRVTGVLVSNGDPSDAAIGRAELHALWYVPRASKHPLIPAATPADPPWPLLHRLLTPSDGAVVPAPLQRAADLPAEQMVSIRATSVEWNRHRSDMHAAPAVAVHMPAAALHPDHPAAALAAWAVAATDALITALRRYAADAARIAGAVEQAPGYGDDAAAQFAWHIDAPLRGWLADLLADPAAIDAATDARQQWARTCRDIARAVGRDAVLHRWQAHATHQSPQGGTLHHVWARFTAAMDTALHAAQPALASGS